MSPRKITPQFIPEKMLPSKTPLKVAIDGTKVIVTNTPEAMKKLLNDFKKIAKSQKEKQLADQITKELAKKASKKILIKRAVLSLLIILASTPIDLFAIWITEIPSSEEEVFDKIDNYCLRKWTKSQPILLEYINVLEANKDKLSAIGKKRLQSLINRGRNYDREILKHSS